MAYNHKERWTKLSEQAFVSRKIPKYVFGTLFLLFLSLGQSSHAATYDHTSDFAGLSVDQIKVSPVTIFNADSDQKVDVQITASDVNYRIVYLEPQLRSDRVDHLEACIVAPGFWSAPGVGPDYKPEADLVQSGFINGRYQVTIVAHLVFPKACPAGEYYFAIGVQVASSPGSGKIFLPNKYQAISW